MPYALLGFDPLPDSAGAAADSMAGADTTIKSGQTNTQGSAVVPATDPLTLPDAEFLSALERISGRNMARSKPLQVRAAQAIAREYGMRNAAVITLTSFSGPAPPEGGYVYWGVRGQIKGQWFVWQPGNNWKLRQGDQLEDPKRYQKCNSPQTTILTPSGPVPIKDIKIGDLVLSANRQAARVLKTSRTRAENHRVCRVAFDDRTVLEISPGHPLADGRLCGGLKPGDAVDGRRVVKNELIPYRHEYTYDILPGSPAGTYYANGLEVASTLAGTSDK